MLKIRFSLLFYVLLLSEVVFSQQQKGKVLSSETNSGLGYVNIGIIHKNIGTVSDQDGNFVINFDKTHDNDSIRFSIIGYETKTFLIANFRKDSIKEVYLTTKIFHLKEIKVTYIFHKPKVITLGTPVTTNVLRTGFAYNTLGSELGIKIFVRRQVKLKDLNLNIATCTFDSVIYRLNIYQKDNKAEYKNILTEPIYIAFSKDNIHNVLTFDLSKYSIIVKGDVLMTLELFKDLGEGRLLFHTEYFTGITYHKKTSQGTWTEAAGVIGMYVHAVVMR